MTKKKSKKSKKRNTTTIRVSAKNIRVRGVVDTDIDVRDTTREMLAELQKHSNKLVRRVGQALEDILDSVEGGAK